MPLENVGGQSTRVTQIIARQLADVRAAVVPPRSPEQTLGLKFSRGDRVRDLTTGLEGEVVRGTRQAALAPVARPFDV